MNFKKYIALFSCLIALAIFGGDPHFALAGGAGIGIDWVGSPYSDSSLNTYVPTPVNSNVEELDTTISGYLAYAWNRWTLKQNQASCFTGTDNNGNSQSNNFSSDTMNSTCVSGFVPAGSDIQVTINQEARVYDATTGTEISDGATLTAGQTLRFEFKKLVPENIYWFGTGYSLDSPYGEWSANAAPPPRVNSTNGGISANHVTCDAQDYTNSIAIQDTSEHEGCLYTLQQNAKNLGPQYACKTYGTDGSGAQVCNEYWYYDSSKGLPQGLMDKAGADADCDGRGYKAKSRYNFDVYAPLEVNPPARTLTYGGLTCSSAAADSDSDVAYTCTVPNTPGATLTPKFNYGSTYGYFYYRYHDYRNMDYRSQSGAGSNALNYGGNGCYGNNIPLYQVRDNVADDPGFNPVSQAGLHVGDVESSPYKLNVPAVSKQLTFTVANPNQPPATPTITGATTGVPSTNYTFTIKSTDPNSDTIRYGIDWNNDGTLDQWVPASGYVASGVSQNAVKQWASAGSVTFKALAQDVKGSNSGWATHTIVIQSLPDLTASSITPTTATAGTSQTFKATVKNSGTGSTGAGFTDRFQWAVNSSGGSAANMGTYSSAALAASASNQASVPFTFSSAGTFYVRVCADQNASGTGSITESNESNNCTAWTAVTVSPAPLQPSATLTCPSTAIAYNTSANLSWTCTNSVSAFISPTIGSVTPVAGGTVSTGNLTSTTLYSLTCTGATGTTPSTNSCSVSVGANLPDLTADSVSPTSAVAGQNTTFNAPIHNTSATASTGVGFKVLFQTASDSSGTGAADIGIYSSPVLAANGNGTASLSYKFPSAGDFYMRVCADKSSAGDTGVINELNENNNCSGTWVKVSVSSPPFGGSVSCTPSPGSVTTGQNVTWTPTPVGITAPITYTWTATGGTPSSGSGSTFTNKYTTPGPYSASVKAQGANGTAGPTSCTPVTVGAVGDCGASTDGDITASPTRVKQNTQTTLSWNAVGVPDSTSCTVADSSGTVVWTGAADAACDVSDGSGSQVTVSAQTTYILSCGGTEIDRVTVDVVPNYQNT